MSKKRNITVNFSELGFELMIDSLTNEKKVLSYIVINDEKDKLAIAHHKNHLSMLISDLLIQKIIININEVPI